MAFLTDFYVLSPRFQTKPSNKSHIVCKYLKTVQIFGFFAVVTNVLQETIQINVWLVNALQLNCIFN